MPKTCDATLAGRGQNHHLHHTTSAPGHMVVFRQAQGTTGYCRSASYKNTLVCDVTTAQCFSSNFFLRLLLQQAVGAIKFSTCLCKQNIRVQCFPESFPSATQMDFWVILCGKIVFLPFSHLVSFTRRRRTKGKKKVPAAIALLT